MGSNTIALTTCEATGRRWARVLSAALLAVVLAALPSGRSHGEGIAVILSADVDVYRQAVEGFKAAVGEPVTRVYDMKGDFSRGSSYIREIREELKPRLILAVGIWALQLVARHSLDTPIVFTMVLNPPSIVSPEARNITGASMNVPAVSAIDLFQSLGPGFRRVGVIYSKKNVGYLVAEAKTLASERGIDLLDVEVSSPKQAIRAVGDLLAQDIGALWLLPDGAVLDPKVLNFILLESYRKQTPLIGVSEDQSKMGAMLALSFASSEDIGRQAGELARAILAGTPVADVPFTEAREVSLTINLKAAHKLGVSIPEDVLAKANNVIR